MNESTDAVKRKYECAICHRAPPNDNVVLLRASAKGEARPVIWLCGEHFNHDDWKNSASIADLREDKERLDFLEASKFVIESHNDPDDLIIAIDLRGRCRVAIQERAKFRTVREALDAARQEK